MVISIANNSRILAYKIIYEDSSIYMLQKNSIGGFFFFIRCVYYRSISKHRFLKREILLFLWRTLSKYNYYFNLCSEQVFTFYFRLSSI